MPKKDVEHSEGPFIGLKTGDVIRIIYHGTPTALMQISKVNQFSLEGKEGDFKCKVTIVSPQELRFYAEIGPNRQTVLRKINLIKVYGLQS